MDIFDKASTASEGQMHVAKGEVTDIIQHQGTDDAYEDYSELVRYGKVMWKLIQMKIIVNLVGYTLCVSSV